MKYYPFLLALTAPLALSCESKSRCITEGVEVTISGNHGHEMSVPKEHLKTGVGGTYPLRGGGHEHAAPLVDEAMKKLSEGQGAETRATSVNAHSHEVKVRCK